MSSYYSPYSYIGSNLIKRRAHRSFAYSTGIKRRYKRRACPLYRRKRFPPRMRNLRNIQEKKVLDFDSTNQTLDWDGLVYLVQTMTKGTDRDDRVGSCINCLYLSLNMVVTKHGTPESSQVKLWVVLDKMTDQQDPVPSNIIDDPHDLTTFRNMDNLKRFKILATRFINVNEDYPEKFTKVNLRLHCRTYFNTGNNGTVADIFKNPIFLIIVSSEETNTPTVRINTRFRYSG